MAGTNDGNIHYFDSRATEPLWTVKGHEMEVTDFGFNANAPSLLVSTSVDQIVKVWKFDSTSCNLVHSQHYKIGRVHCLHEAPENNWFIGLGGDKRKKNFIVSNLLDYESVRNAFTANDERPSNGESQEVKMEEDAH